MLVHISRDLVANNKRFLHSLFLSLVAFAHRWQWTVPSRHCTSSTYSTPTPTRAPCRKKQPAMPAACCSQLLRTKPVTPRSMHIVNVCLSCDEPANRGVRAGANWDAANGHIDTDSVSKDNVSKQDIDTVQISNGHSRGTLTHTSLPMGFADTMELQHDCVEMIADPPSSDSDLENAERERTQLRRRTGRAVAHRQTRSAHWW